MTSPKVSVQARSCRSVTARLGLTHAQHHNPAPDTGGSPWVTVTPDSGSTNWVWKTAGEEPGVLHARLLHVTSLRPAAGWMCQQTSPCCPNCPGSSRAVTVALSQVSSVPYLCNMPVQSTAPGTAGGSECSWLQVLAVGRWFLPVLQQTCCFHSGSF